MIKNLSDALERAAREAEKDDDASIEAHHVLRVQPDLLLDY